MKIQAFAKINWTLNILGARPDGYHEMDMLMQPISLCDELTLEEADGITLFVGGASLGEARHNLVVRAAHALNEACGTSYGARIALIKRIPVKAGLGGGSADCAATLKGLNALWGLNLPMDALMRIGAKLGADVPFCLLQKPARAKGLGEILEPIDLPGGVPLVILHPGEGLSTPAMFRAWDGEGAHLPPADIDACARSLASRDLGALMGLSKNALLPAALAALPAVGDACDALLSSGAGFVAMSGSGSAVFGAFGSKDGANRALARLGNGAIFAETLG